MTVVVEQPTLRERKKAKTRASIQREAMHLFSKQGYDATTVEQIAAAAEVSESTFFRYFPSKEEVVLWDQFDTRVIEAYKAQPDDVHPIDALRQAYHVAFAELSTEELEEVRQRSQLMSTVPALRGALLDQMASAMRGISEAVAERTHRPAGDFGARVIAGAVMGVAMAVMTSMAEDPDASLSEMLERGLSELRRGLAD